MSTKTVVKSISDDREYRYIVLSNKMRVLLISDAATDKAAASLDVNVGQLSDPREYPGLAHFLEHAMFMGTTKYPKINHFSELSALRGSSSNAYTSTQSTNYHFDVVHSHFEELLEVWSQFFTCPLFSEEAIDKEINAVHSEHDKNINNDIWRFMQVDKVTSNPDHPISNFGTGNLETLRDRPAKNNVSIRNEMIAFYQKYYSSNIMNLVLLGRESLDDLEAMATKYFEKVPNNDVVLPEYGVPVLRKEDRMNLIRVLPIKDSHYLELNFEVRDVITQYFNIRPLIYISHLIGHEGKGSVLSFLKGKGWATSLSASDSRKIRGSTQFTIYIDLTEAGLSHYQEIISLLFSFIKLIKERGVQKWSFDEVISISKTRFDYKDKVTPLKYVTMISSHMHHAGIEDVLTSMNFAKHYDEEAIHAVLSDFIIENSRVIIITQKMDLVTPLEHKLGKVVLEDPVYEYTTTPVDDLVTIETTSPNAPITPITNGAPDSDSNTIQFTKEHFYGVEYNVSPYPQSLVSKINTHALHPQIESGEVHLAKVNMFIPQNFDITHISGLEKFIDTVNNMVIKEAPSIKGSCPLDYPVVIEEIDNYKLWYKLDKTFKLPKASIIMKVNFTKAYLSPIDTIYLKIYIDLIKDALNEIAYDAELAGLAYNIDQAIHGLNISVNGYHDKLKDVTGYIFDTIIALNVIDTKFHVRINKFKRSLQNFSSEQPYEHAVYSITLLTRKTLFSKSEKLAVIDQATPEGLREYIDTIMTAFSIDALVHGNIGAKEAMELGNCTKKLFKNPPADNTVDGSGKNINMLKVNATELLQHHLLFEKDTNYLVKTYETVNTISGIEVVLLTGMEGIMSTAMTRLLAKCMTEKFFHELRTIQQLGYIVFSGSRTQTGVNALRFIIQGNKTAEYFDHQIESFLADLEVFLHELSDEQFTKFKTALISKCLETYKTLREETNVYWHEIAEETYDFSRVYQEAKYLESVDKEDLIQFYDKFVKPGSLDRIRIASHAIGLNSADQALDIIPDSIHLKTITHNLVEITDPNAFKRAANAKFYPLPTPTPYTKYLLN